MSVEDIIIFCFVLLVVFYGDQVQGSHICGEANDSLVNGWYTPCVNVLTQSNEYGNTVFVNIHARGEQSNCLMFF